MNKNTTFLTTKQVNMLLEKSEKVSLLCKLGLHTYVSMENGKWKMCIKCFNSVVFIGNDTIHKFFETFADKNTECSFCKSDTRWINVNDKLPELGKPVAVYYDGSVPKTPKPSIIKTERFVWSDERIKEAEYWNRIVLKTKGGTMYRWAGVRVDLQPHCTHWMHLDTKKPQKFSGNSYTESGDEDG